MAKKKIGKETVPENETKNIVHTEIVERKTVSAIQRGLDIDGGLGGFIDALLHDLVNETIDPVIAAQINIAVGKKIQRAELLSRAAHRLKKLTA